MRDWLARRRIELAFGAVGVMVFVVLVLAYSRRAPLGEAPDEPAHLEYLRMVLLEGSVPGVPNQLGALSYELHQPPLAYRATAMLLQPWWSLDQLPILVPAPAFHFGQPPGRFVEGAPLQGWWPPRWVNGCWALLFVPALWACVVCSQRSRGGVAAFVLLLLTPQLIFAFATFSNDAAAIALSTLSFALLLRAHSSRSDAGFVLAVLVGGLALWAKLTAAFLVFPFLVIAVTWGRRRAAVFAACLWLTAMVGLLAYQFSRGIPPGHAVPPGWALSGGSPLSFVAEPGWVVTLWLGTWAKLGWFNVHLPIAAYAWFVVPTAAIAAGVWVVWRTKSRAGLVSVAGLGGAIVLLMVYMVSSDWQPQGRLLLPAVGPACVLATLGLEELGRRAGQPPSAITAGCALGGTVVCLLGLRALSLAYGFG